MMKIPSLSYASAAAAAKRDTKQNWKLSDAVVSLFHHQRKQKQKQQSTKKYPTSRSHENAMEFKRISLEERVEV